ncbi:MAG: MFS transporter [Thiohalospira sp.]
MTGIPYGRLSAFYLFYFAVLGTLVPYWPVYLDHLAFSSAEIGGLMALVMATKIVAPNFWGWLADRSGRRMPWVRGGSLLGLLAFAFVALAGGFWSLAAVMLAFSFFWNAVLAQFEANTFNHLQGNEARYSHIRLWGSVGFILTAVGLGPLLDLHGAALVPWAVGAGLAAIWLTSLGAPEGPPTAAPEAGEERLGAVLARPAVLAFLAACLLMQASHGPYYTFFSLYMRDIGYSGWSTGLLWGLGVAAEVGMFLVMHRLMGRFALAPLLVVSFALTALRWLVLALFPGSVPLVIGAQILHAASFGLYHAVAIALVHHVFRGRLQGRGQALYSSLGFGAGGAVGSLYGGLLWDGAGATATFAGAAGMAAVGGLLALLAVPRLAGQRAPAPVE